jgi:hypothetical protein
MAAAAAAAAGSQQQQAPVSPFAAPALAGAGAAAPELAQVHATKVAVAAGARGQAGVQQANGKAQGGAKGGEGGKQRR